MGCCLALSVQPNIQRKRHIKLPIMFIKQTSTAVYTSLKLCSSLCSSIHPKWWQVGHLRWHSGDIQEPDTRKGFVDGDYKQIPNTGWVWGGGSVSAMAVQAEHSQHRRYQQNLQSSPGPGDSNWKAVKWEMCRTALVLPPKSSWPLDIWLLPHMLFS